MTELETCSVQHQSMSGLLPVEMVACNRASRCRDLNTKLVGASGLGIKLEERAIAGALQHSITRDRFLSGRLAAAASSSTTVGGSNHLHASFLARGERV